MRNTSFHDDLEHKLAVLRDHCAEAGRDITEISKTVTTAFDLGEDRQAGLNDLLDHVRELGALGFDHVLVSPRRSWDEATLDAILSILPDIHALEPRA